MEPQTEADLPADSRVAYRPEARPSNLGRPARQGEDFVSLADALRFLRRWWWCLASGGLIAAIITGVVIVFFVSPRFESAATLVVVPMTVKSDLKPRVLSIQGYQQLLESGAVVDDTRRRLVDEGTLTTDQSLEVGDELESRIFVSRREEETTLAPMLEAVAHGRTAESAARIANVWSEVFLEQARQLLSDSLAPNIELVEAQYQSERQRLQELERERIRVANEFQERFDSLELSWDRKILQSTKTTEDEIGRFHTTTRLQMEQFAIKAGLDLTPLEVEVEDSPSRSLSSSDGSVEKKLLQILALRIQLAQTPRLLVLEKAVSDDTLWQAMALSPTAVVDLDPILDRRLITQEANSVYNDLALRLTQVEIDAQNLTKQQQGKVQAFTSGLENLQVERSAGLAKLFAERALEEDLLKREKTRRLNALQRDHQAQLDELDRDIDHQKALFGRLAQSYREVTLARAEQSYQDLRLGAVAVPPVEPEERNLRVMVLLAGVLGGVAGLFFALMKEIGTS